LIRYSLQCRNDHHFEEWFSNSADYDAQAEAGTLTCPECGDHGVAKAIMAPSIGKSAAAPTPACPVSGCGGGGGCRFAEAG